MIMYCIMYLYYDKLPNSVVLFATSLLNHAAFL